jgi:hypothetical protein
MLTVLALSLCVVQEMESINVNVVGFVWVYCLAWFLLQDITKVGMYKLLWDWDIEFARSEYEAQVRACELRFGGNTNTSA